MFRSSDERDTIIYCTGFILQTVNMILAEDICKYIDNLFQRFNSCDCLRCFRIESYQRRIQNLAHRGEQQANLFLSFWCEAVIVVVHVLCCLRKVDAVIADSLIVADTLEDLGGRVGFLLCHTLAGNLDEILA